MVVSEKNAFWAKGDLLKYSKWPLRQTDTQFWGGIIMKGQVHPCPLDKHWSYCSFTLVITYNVVGYLKSTYSVIYICHTYMQNCYPFIFLLPLNLPVGSQ